MHILFVYPDISRVPAKSSPGAFAPGVGYLSAVCKRAGHKTSLLHLTQMPSRTNFLDRVANLSPNLVGFSTTTNQYEYVRALPRWIKEEFPTPTICGGIHATMAPEEVMASSTIDILCRGEGEDAIVELASALEQGKEIQHIRNLWVREGTYIHKNPLRPLLQDLDSLPFPDRGLFSYEQIVAPKGSLALGRMGDIMTSRGCPFHCAYCCNDAWRKLYPGQMFIRRRSVENVLQEIRQLVERYQIDNLFIQDDLFTMQPKWLREFCQRYGTEIGLHFICNAFPTTLNKETVSMLKAAGCYQVTMGVEVGDESFRRTVLQRPGSNKQIAEAFGLLRAFGLQSGAYVMLGLPGETDRTAKETLRLIDKIDPDFVSPSIFYPYPGTPLYEACKEKGWLTGEYQSTFREDTILNNPTYTRHQLHRDHRKLQGLSLRRQVRRHYPYLLPLYSLAWKVLGDRLAYRISILARSILKAVEHKILGFRVRMGRGRSAQKNLHPH